MPLRRHACRSDRRAFLAAAVGSIAGITAAARGGLLRLAEAHAATGPTLETRVIELGRGRALAGAEPIARFDLVGLHWRGSGSVAFRTRDLAGRWSAWVPASDGHLPDPQTDEGRSNRAFRLGAPVWTGGSDRIEYRLRGDVDKLLAHLVASPTLPLGGSRRPASAGQPAIITRAVWGANESIVRRAPAYAERLTLAVVHHTAGKRPSTPAESAAVLRAIQTYHVQANGWNDIGYNFLVDPFGLMYEGRGGGLEANVIGAHALGFNTGSVGVALLGNFEKQALTDAERQALVGLLAWRLDVAHLDPLAPASMGGASIGPLAGVVGHSDVNATSCPGRNVHPLLDEIAAEASMLGAPKLFDPRADGVLGGPIHFTARLSEARSWTVTVTDAAGALAGQGFGVGSIVDWTLPTSSPDAAPYAWVIDAGSDVRPASGQLAVEASVMPPRPERPIGLPKRIPAWAWEMHAWHSLPPRQRGPRPSTAPRKLPRWYWTWRKWRLAVESWAAAS